MSSASAAKKVYDDELASEGFLKWYFLSKQVLERRRPFESFRQTVHVTVTKNGMDKEIVKGFQVVARICDGEIRLKIRKLLPPAEYSLTLLISRAQGNSIEYFKRKKNVSSVSYHIPVYRKPDGRVSTRTNVCCSWVLVPKLADREATQETKWGGLARRLRRSRGKTSDVVLEVDGESLQAHQAVLCAFSPVFAAMFGHVTTTESQKGIVCIKDVDMKTMKIIVGYMYEEGLDEDLGLEQLCKLLVAVDKYDVAQLRQQCEQMLAKLLSPATASRIANVASQVPTSGGLREDTVVYLAENLWRIIPRLEEGLSELPWDLVAEAATLKNEESEEEEESDEEEEEEEEEEGE